MTCRRATWWRWEAETESRIAEATNHSTEDPMISRWITRPMIFWENWDPTEGVTTTTITITTTTE